MRDELELVATGAAIFGAQSAGLERSREHQLYGRGARMTSREWILIAQVGAVLLAALFGGCITWVYAQRKAKIDASNEKRSTEIHVDELTKRTIANYESNASSAESSRDSLEKLLELRGTVFEEERAASSMAAPKLTARRCARRVNKSSASIGT